MACKDGFLSYNEEDSNFKVFFCAAYLQKVKFTNVNCETRQRYVIEIR